MTNPSVSITLPSGTQKTIATRSVLVGHKKINTVNPNANIGSGLANVQTQGINNPTYNMTVTFDNNFSAAAYLQYTDLLDLVAHQYAENNPAILTIYYGKSPSAVILPSFTKGTSGIPVILESGSFPLDVSDSNSAYQQTVNLTFIETKDLR